MRVYYRAVPKTTVAPVNRYVRDYQDAFSWVLDIKEATEDYLPSCETTKEKLRKQHGIETELVEVQDDKLMQPQYVLVRDVEFDRVKNQIIEPGKGITTNTDEILTNPKPDETTFNGAHENLDRDEDELEDKDRK
ncbi:MAG: hypothetical protein WB556_03060 [Candidatus Acidiferrum sp.]